MTTLWSYEALDTAQPTRRAVLKSIVERISGGAHVVWRDERQEFPADGVIVKLHTQGRSTAGTPEPRERQDLEDEGAEVKVDVVEHGTFTLQVLVECFDQVEAGELAKLIRRRFYRPYTLDRLRSVNCAVVRVEGANDLPTSYDHRVWSAVAFDVRLNVCDVDLQEDFDGDGDDTDATTFIETVSFRAPVEPPPADAIASDYAVVPPPAA